jgi:hypothetical protein
LRSFATKARGFAAALGFGVDFNLSSFERYPDLPRNWVALFFLVGLDFTLSVGAMLIRPNFRPAGTRWGATGWYYEDPRLEVPFTYLVFGDGSMISPPAEFPAIVPGAEIRWRGDVGEGVERDWVFTQADETRLGGTGWWREDVSSLWNRKLDEFILPPAWMTSTPGVNGFCSWRAEPLAQVLTKRGKVRINAKRLVRIIVDYSQPITSNRLMWYAENRIYQVWPPYSGGG